jgi:hypothetical protein
LQPRGRIVPVDRKYSAKYFAGPLPGDDHFGVDGRSVDADGITAARDSQARSHRSIGLAIADMYVAAMATHHSACHRQADNACLMLLQLLNQILSVSLAWTPPRAAIDPHHYLTIHGWISHSPILPT